MVLFCQKRRLVQKVGREFLDRLKSEWMSGSADAFLFLDTYLTVIQCDGIRAASMNGTSGATADRDPGRLAWLKPGVLPTSPAAAGLNP
jgi:hypothetical protein